MKKDSRDEAQLQNRCVQHDEEDNERREEMEGEKEFIVVATNGFEGEEGHKQHKHEAHKAEHLTIQQYEFYVGRN